MDSRICQTFAVSPAEPGDFPLLVNESDSPPMRTGREPLKMTEGYESPLV